MREYKYSYQDWLRGNIEPDSLSTLHYKGELSFDAYIKILNDQDEAYLKRLSDSLECFKEDFTRVYKTTLTKNEYLNFYIGAYNTHIEKLKETDEGKVIVFESFYFMSDGRGKLTAKQVDEYLSFDVTNDKARFTLLNILRQSEKKITSFSYILNVQFLQWLYWFQEQQESIKIEPAINLLSRYAVNEIEKAPEELKAGFISYKWQSNPITELPELYQLLLDKDLIHTDTTLEHLLAVFTEQPLYSITTPVKWHDDNASELLYFIQQLEGTDGSIIEKGERANYKRLKVCFVKSDGKPFTENFRQIKQNLKNCGLALAKRQVIDSIVQQFY